ncbi:polyprenyl diphosphate synthase [Streptomyces sp. NPDC020799]|uniref:polyprenyl diphosphate synthase n=1 Tax=unclassified Streptomyces TaxID=2593676 RepID=UPI0033D5F18A
MPALTAREPELRHVAVILDGNRRWAQGRRVPLEQAYRQGALRVHDLVSWCEQAGVRAVTVWALSQDNLHRRPQEVAQILDSVTHGLERIVTTTRWHIRLVGDLDRIPAHHTVRLRTLALRSARAQRAGTLTIAVAYDGRADIVTAIRSLLHERTPEERTCPIDESAVGRHLSTAGQPDIDLVIRTSGEQRLSGFMPWQAAHAELYFTDTLWPDFTRGDFDEARRWFAGRQRRHGS